MVERTRWGGIADGRHRGTGLFSLATADGVSWLVDPDGGRFLSKGITTVRFDQDAIRDTDRIPYAQACGLKYGSIEAWRAAAATRLVSFGFNSLGAWSDELVASAGPTPLALAPVLHLGQRFSDRQHQAGLPTGAFPDVFDPGFESFVRRLAHEMCSGWRGNPHIIGFFTDNELYWGADWRGADPVLLAFIRQPAGSFARRAGLAMLRARHAGFDAFSEVWPSAARTWADLEHAGSDLFASTMPPDRPLDAATGDAETFLADCDAFVGELARRYFHATVAAVKAADPEHLSLGCRFATVPRPVVLAQAAAHLDIISLNCYDGDPDPVLTAYAAVGKPFLIGEFAFRGDDAGLPNSRGGGPRVPTQRDRARGFESYAMSALRQPGLVGYHWFEHADQPAEGRFDGEDCNYGIVTIADDVYPDLTRAMSALHDRAEMIHAGESLVATSASPGHREADNAPSPIV